MLDTRNRAWLYEGDYPLYYSKGEPNKNYSKYYIDDDIFGFLHLFVIAGTNHESKTSIDNVNNSNKTNKGDQIGDNILSILRDWLG